MPLHGYRRIGRRIDLRFRRRPAAAERLIKADDRLQAREPCLRERVLRLKQGLLRLQHGHEIDRAFAQPRFGDLEARLRALVDDLALGRSANRPAAATAISALSTSPKPEITALR